MDGAKCLEVCDRYLFGGDPDDVSCAIVSGSELVRFPSEDWMYTVFLMQIVDVLRSPPSKDSDF